MNWFVSDPSPALLVVAAAGCGSSSANHTTTRAAAPTTTTNPVTTSSVSVPNSPGALQAEANAAAAGDIPDARSSSPSTAVTPATRSSTRKGGRNREPVGRSCSGTRTIIAESSSRLARPRPRLRSAVTSCTWAARRYRSRRRPIALPRRSSRQDCLQHGQCPEPGHGQAGDARRRSLLPLAARSLRRDRSRRSVGVDNVDAYRLIIESFRWR